MNENVMYIYNLQSIIIVQCVIWFYEKCVAYTILQLYYNDDCLLLGMIKVFNLEYNNNYYNRNSVL